VVSQKEKTETQHREHPDPVGVNAVRSTGGGPQFTVESQMRDYKKKRQQGCRTPETKKAPTKVGAQFSTLNSLLQKQSLVKRNFNDNDK
jgi:hypothetical protein